MHPHPHSHPYPQMMSPYVPPQQSNQRQCQQESHPPHQHQQQQQHPHHHSQAPMIYNNQQQQYHRQYLPPDPNPSALTPGQLPSQHQQQLALQHHQYPAHFLQPPQLSPPLSHHPYPYPHSHSHVPTPAAAYPSNFSFQQLKSQSQAVPPPLNAPLPYSSGSASLSVSPSPSNAFLPKQQQQQQAQKNVLTHHAQKLNSTLSSSASSRSSTIPNTPTPRIITLKDTRPSSIKLLCLGAGHDVGRSCVIIRMNQCNIMLDCGLHMTPRKNDNYRFPEFTHIPAFCSDEPAVMNAENVRNNESAATQSSEPSHSPSPSPSPSNGKRDHTIAEDEHPQSAATASFSESQNESETDTTQATSASQSNTSASASTSTGTTLSTRTRPNLNDYIDVCVVTHFHLDHVGAIPYLTERARYSNDIYMTPPTLAIAPLLLKDYVKVAKWRTGLTLDSSMYNVDDIDRCMKKVKCIAMNSSIRIPAKNKTGGADRNRIIEIRALQAGHVIGASMFHIQVGNQSILYTGDYNTSHDHHLNASYMPSPLSSISMQLDVLISESTYATTIRNIDFEQRDNEFVQNIVQCALAGGKVLIPIFAIGRTQELCLLLDTYWRHHQHQLAHIPIYFSAGITSQTNSKYKHYISYTNDIIQDTYFNEGVDAFSFPCIKQYEPSVIDRTDACVVLATPGMLLSGLSLEIFSRWAPDKRNMVVLPGYCSAGSVGNKVLAGMKHIEADLRGTAIEFDVNCSISHMSFSAHADATGIMSLIRATQPRYVVLVHGEREKMPMLAARIESELHIPAYCPPNYQVIEFQPSKYIPACISMNLLNNIMNDKSKNLSTLVKRHMEAKAREEERPKRIIELEEGEDIDDEVKVDSKEKAMQHEHDVTDVGAEKIVSYLFDAEIVASSTGAISVIPHKSTK